jgi:chitinase
MTYDYHGQWDKKTGHVAPMFDHFANTNEYFNVVSILEIWNQRSLQIF